MMKLRLDQLQLRKNLVKLTEYFSSFADWKDDNYGAKAEVSDYTRNYHLQLIPSHLDQD